MNPFEQMELLKSSFTKQEMKVYDIVNNNIDDILRDSATAIAEKNNVSQSAITRFCQKLGYQGYNDFRYDIYKYKKKGSIRVDQSSVIDYYSKIIQLIPNAVSEDEFENLAKQIINADFVYINGFHKSSLPAQLLEMNLAKFKIKAVVERYDYVHTLPSTINKNDLVIFFSAASTVYKDANDALLELGENKPKTVLVTMNKKHVLRNKVDTLIWLPNYKNQSYPVYLENQVIALVFVDILTSYIAHLKVD